MNRWHARRATLSALGVAATLAFAGPADSSSFTTSAPYVLKEFALIHDGSLYHLFFMRRDLENPDAWFTDLGHAVSPDLTTWQEVDPVLPIRTDKWDNYQIWAPGVFKQGEVYYLFYTAVTHVPGVTDYHQRIGIATSTDLYNWTRPDVPMFQCSDAPWTYCDSTLAVGGDFRDAFVMEDPGTPGEYLLYYVARGDADHDQFLVGAARSTGDLSQWTSLAPLDATHRLKTGSYVTESIHLLPHDGLWYMFYTTWNVHPISYQTSADPLADSSGWSPQVTLADMVPTSYTDPWFGSEHISVAGRDYFAAVNSEAFTIEFREIVWREGGGFDFAEPEPAAVIPRPSGWSMSIPALSPSWEQMSIRVTAPAPSSLQLGVYDVTGRLERTLLSGTVPAGTTTIQWDGTDDRGARLAAGMYFVSLRAPGFSASRRVVRFR